MDYSQKTDEQLIMELRAGNHEIMDYLMVKYKDIVRMKAKKMYLLGGEESDLIQEGMIGLFKAVEDFQPDAGASFSSFAQLCINRQLHTAIKLSQRKKHIPLNEYVSLDARKLTEAGEDIGTIGDSISDDPMADPELQYTDSKYAQDLIDRLYEKLSKLETKVLKLHLMGMDYLKIADLIDKSPKAVDNALQRIKAKTRQLLDEDNKQ